MIVLIHPEAAVELKEAASFYAERAHKELGLALLAEFERAIGLLSDNPELGAMWRGVARRFPLRRFPYSVIYRFIGGSIQVLAVAHQRRRPGYWKKRR
ncbi:type II toxin-antitoxin system RelE/ParE family toxin [Azoarcus sp. KH32C]|uniref:type II toxin-antitoxin system RelE/ParE family toxin n=1 Tax=Azoarcus sp. KH32C TaxID=748247 RepID=UPI00023867A5|nr:type II toxin-antitoxin system RelE/ParE family toxin [Azoarcus sp. KH32C]BAL26403.1 putative plasmid stabilization system protein, RelE/ParE family [Azoarcus sp. KH32C]